MQKKKNALQSELTTTSGNSEQESSFNGFLFPETIKRHLDEDLYAEVIGLYLNLPHSIIHDIETILGNLPELSYRDWGDEPLYKNNIEPIIESIKETQEQLNYEELVLNSEKSLSKVLHLHERKISKRIIQKSYFDCVIRGVAYDVRIWDDELPIFGQMSEAQGIFLKNLSTHLTTAFPESEFEQESRWINVFSHLHTSDHFGPLFTAYSGAFTALLSMTGSWWRDAKLNFFMARLEEAKDSLVHSKLAVELSKMGSAHPKGEKHGEEPHAKEFAAVVGKASQKALLDKINGKNIPSDKVTKELNRTLTYASELLKGIPSNQITKIFSYEGALSQESRNVAKFISLILIDLYAKDKEGVDIGFQELGLSEFYKFLKGSSLLQTLDLKRVIPHLTVMPETTYTEDLDHLIDLLLKENFEYVIKTTFFLCILKNIYTSPNLDNYQDRIVEEVRLNIGANYQPRADALVFPRTSQSITQSNPFMTLDALIKEKKRTKVKIIEIKTMTGIHGGHSKKIQPRDDDVHQVFRYLEAIEKFYPDTVVVDEVIFYYLTYRGIEVIRLTPEKLIEFENNRKV